MYDKVLVTLDGSQLAESVLPWLSKFVRVSGTTKVMLLSVAEAGTGVEKHMAEGYLRDRATQLEKTLQEKGGAVPQVTFVAVGAEPGGVASAIIHFAEDNGVDLMMLSTHGRSGFERWFMGSIAEKVLRGSEIPMFLVNAASIHHESSSSINRLLVPLDGSKLAEKALPHVETLARSAEAEVVLVHVEPNPDIATFSRHPESRGRAHRMEESNSYLASIASGLTSSGVKVTTKVRVGQPSQQIVEEAEESCADLIVMCSHGHSSLARWAFGSVADQVLHGSPMPVLLIPASIAAEVPAHLQGRSVYRCHHCGRRTYLETFTSKSQCSYCQYFLKACGNCIHYDGLGCILQLPYASDVYPGNRCPQFEFRKTRLTLR